MRSFVVICYLILVCFSINRGEVVFSVIEGKSNWEQKWTKKIIKFLSEKLGYNKKGWIDPSQAYGSSSKYMQLQMNNGEIICKSENAVVEFKSYKQKLVKKTSLAYYYNLYVHYADNSKYLQIVNPIPLSVPINMKYALTKESSKEKEKDEEDEEEKEYYEDVYSEKITDNKFNISKEISEGYLVCEKVGKQPLLIPKYMEKPEFLLSPWAVTVDIVMYKNPVIAFGRQYVIIILDNIDILKSKKKFFFWPAPITSMVDVYFFHLAMKESKKGKFCSLSRISGTGEIQLQCDVSEQKFSIDNINAHLTTGLIFMNLANIIDYPFLKLRKLKYRVEKRKDGKIRNVLLNLDEGSSKSVSYNKPKSYVTFVEGWKIKKKLFLLKNLAYLCVWSMFNILYRLFYFNHIRNLLKEADEQLKTTDAIYAGKLEYPLELRQNVYKYVHYKGENKKEEKGKKKQKEKKSK